jgi:predicted acyltransferase
MNTNPSMTKPSAPAPSPRLLSLDALRGFDMFWIMSGEQIVHALAKTTGWTVFNTLSDQLHHTVWDGFTFYDMIFPLFLFIAGAAMPFSLHKKVQQAGVPAAHELPARDKRQLVRRMLRRTILLILLGMVVNGALRFNGLENTRFPSVLGRIGIAWFFAGIIYLSGGLRWQVGWFCWLLIGYWAVMMLVPVPGYGAGVLTMEGSLESYIDRLLLPGRLHDRIHDPEGVLSTIPAIGTALLGVFTGSFLKWEDVEWPMKKKGWVLATAGFIVLLAGILWGLVFPINKRLWTPSFVLYAGGWSILLLSVFYGVIDVAGYRKWAFPFIIIGANSIVIYIASEGAIHFGHTANYVFGGLIHLSPLAWQPVWTALSVTIVQWIFLYFLYRNKLFLKI